MDGGCSEARDPILDEVMVHVAAVLGVEPAEIDNEAALDVTPGWDSLAHAILMIRIEDLTGDAIGPDRMAALRSVPDIVRYVVERRG